MTLVPADPATLDRVDDPGAMMVALVDQARALLAQAKGMEGLAEVVEIKSRAEAIRVYTQQKDMGHEAELSAAEIVRRAERRIGELIRDGQEAGEIRRRGQHDQFRGDDPSHGDLLSPSDFAKQAELSGVRSDGIYAMTDGVTSEQFEEALNEAKEEGNLSRANVARKARSKAEDDVFDRIRTATENNPVSAPRHLPLQQRAEQIRELAAKSYTSPQIADELNISPERVRDLARRLEVEIPADAVFGGRFRKIDPNKVIDGIVSEAEVPSTVLAMVAYSELDRDRIEEWVSSLTVAIRSLQTIKRNLLKELTREQA